MFSAASEGGGKSGGLGLELTVLVVALVAVVASF